MRITLACSAWLFVCFIQIEAHSLAEITMSDMIEMTQIYEEVKSKPFGCLNIKPKTEVTTPHFECLKKMAEEFIAESPQNDKVELLSFKNVLVNFALCRLENYDLIVDGKFDVERYTSFHDSITYEETPSPEDLAIFNGAIKECIKTVQVGDLSADRALMALDKCIFKQTIDRCTKDRGAESVGILLPIIYALNSFIDDNKACDSVEADPEIKDEYEDCVITKEDSSSSSEEEQVPLSNNLMENIMVILKCGKEIPEIECLLKLKKKYVLSDDGNTNFEAVADYVGKLKTWKNGDPKDKVTEAITKCGDVNADIAWWERYIEFNTCFLPAYADICGLDNKLSSDVLFPQLNKEFLNSILNRFNEKLDVIGLLKMILKKKLL